MIVDVYCVRDKPKEMIDLQKGCSVFFCLGKPSDRFENGVYQRRLTVVGLWVVSDRWWLLLLSL